jgi:hypothetical protein
MKPYISTHLNNDNDVVITYIDEVNPYEQVTPECLVIKSDHIEMVIAELQEALESL